MQLNIWLIYVLQKSKGKSEIHSEKGDITSEYISLNFVGKTQVRSFYIIFVFLD